MSVANEERFEDEYCRQEGCKTFELQGSSFGRPGLTNSQNAVVVRKKNRGRKNRGVAQYFLPIIVVVHMRCRPDACKQTLCRTVQVKNNCENGVLQNWGTEKLHWVRYWFFFEKQWMSRINFEKYWLPVIRFFVFNYPFIATFNFAFFISMFGFTFRFIWFYKSAEAVCL